MEFNLLNRENTANKVKCHFCGESCGAIIKHLKSCEHSKMSDKTPEEAEKKYSQIFPGAPLYTVEAYEKLMKKLGRSEPNPEADIQQKQPEQAMNKKQSVTMGVPEIDENYVIPETAERILRMGLDRNDPVYIYGMPGTGKTALPEQYAARNNIPLIRVQHSGQIEDWEILGTERVNKEGSYFAEGLLGMAMKNGWIYLADEYDFTQPQVLANYQAVLEGKPLVIRGANNGNNVIEPHPDFRFVALGNTNGAGDEDGLFQGTKLQNAANMERFSIVYRMDGIGEDLERQIVMKKTQADEQLCEEAMDYVRMVRAAFEKGKIVNTVGGIRVILNIINNGIDLGDMLEGTKLGFSNRLPSRDSKICEAFAQRIWG